MADKEKETKEKMADVKEILRPIIEVLHDGHKGMVEIGHHLENESAKLFLLNESQVRAEFAAELENELHRAGEHDVKEGGTAAGAVHRVWGDLKAHLGGGDHTLLTTLEQGEDAAKEAYDKALGQKLPGNIREVLQTQQRHVMSTHDKVRAWRDKAA